MTRLCIHAGLGALAIAALLALAASDGARPALAQHAHGHGAGTSSAGPAGVTISMEALHRAGGVPPGWRFSWPAGDAQKGREAFAKLECYQCHEVKGESFPPVAQDPTRRGPALGGMGDHHPAEYFAESILNPNAVVVTGPGHTGPDGRSIMPDFRDSLTLAEAIDLVAFIRSLTGGHDHGHHGSASAQREQVTGDYRVRVTYAAPGDGGHAHHRHGVEHHGQPRPHGQPAARGGAPGHLMVFVADATRGEPLPYLPITATIHAPKSAPRAVKLGPMVSAQGFHYGADVTLPAGISKIVVAIGKPLPALRLAPAESARFGKGAEVSFDWGK
jgi:L-cysteine S-thiosulfotransferase